MSASVIQSGDYLLEIDTGWDSSSFLLDDPTKGILAGYVTSTTRTNLVPNPSFETNTTGWNPNGSTNTRVAGTWGSGSWVYRIVATGTGNSGTFTNNNIFPVTVGVSYTASLSAKSISGNLRRLYVGLVWYNAAGAQISFVMTNKLLTTGVQIFSATGTAPALAVTGGLFAYTLDGGLANDTFEMDSVLTETGSSVLPYFDGTYASTYTGYTLTDQAWNGTANASSSTATWGLTSSYVPSIYPLGPTTSYAEVTDGVLNVSITRGRRDIGDQFVPGIMNFTLNDQLSFGAFNPFNVDSPTYDPENNQPGIAPMRRVRFYRYNSLGVAESLFQGFIVSYDYQFSLDGNDLVGIQAIDDQYLLSQAFLDEWNVTEEIASTRVVNLLALPEVDAFQGVGQQSIETSAITLGGAAAWTVPSGSNAQGYLNDILAAEQGRAFVDRSGVFTFQKRLGSTLSGPTVEFGDNDPAHTPYDSVSINFGADKVTNRASVTHLGATTPQTVDDTASQATYFIQAVAYTKSLVHNDAAALDLATYLIQGEPTATLTSVKTGFQMLSTAERDTVAILEIGDTISIEKTITTSSTTTSVIAQESFVEGIEHRISFSQPHEVIVYTSPTSVYQLFILDSSTLDTVFGLS